MPPAKSGLPCRSASLVCYRNPSCRCSVVVMSKPVDSLLMEHQAATVRNNVAVTHRGVKLPAARGLRPPAPIPGAIWIPLRNRRGIAVAYALVDEDNAHLAALRWHRATGGYAHRFEEHEGRRVGVFLHRVVLGGPSELECDHINRDRLDNRRANLRPATRSQNSRNQMRREPRKYKGVQIVRSTNRWQALITFDRKQYPLGLFTSPEAAAFAYDFAALALHGEFAATNFKHSPAIRVYAAELGAFLVSHRSNRTD